MQQPTSLSSKPERDAALAARVGEAREVLQFPLLHARTGEAREREASDVLDRPLKLVLVAPDDRLSELLVPVVQMKRLGPYPYEIETLGDDRAQDGFAEHGDTDVFIIDESLLAVVASLPHSLRSFIEGRSIVVTHSEIPGPASLTSAATIPLARVSPAALDHSIVQIVRHNARRIHAPLQEPAGKAYDVLLRLARMKLVSAGEVEHALRPITEAAAAALGVGRVSVWMLRDHPKRLVCLDMFDLKPGVHYSGAEVPAALCPVYCMALRNHRLLAINDAHHDVRSRELADIYLRPNGIGAILDAPIYLDGEVVGMICHAHLGGPRVWTSDEQHLAASFADYAHLVLLANKRRKAEDALAEKDLQLAQAQKMEALGKLASGIAHDFNNLLTVILGRAQVLQQKQPVEQQSDRNLQHIVTACEQACAVVQQLLTFARKSPRQSVWVNLHKVIDEVAEMLTHTIGPNITIKRDLQATSAIVYGDPAHLQRALLNLGINARDAMPKGGEVIFSTRLAMLPPSLGVDILHHESGRSFVEVAVRDTGTGMTAEVKQRAMEPYFTTKEAGKGTGLGLANVYGCVKDHDGQVVIDSEPGRGTRIGIFLPLHSGPVVERGNQGVQRAPAGAGTILLVDDDQEVRQAVTYMLEFLGYTVLQAANGIEAIEIFTRQRQHVDLVLLDVLMPRMDGSEAFRALKALKPDLRCLLISGFAPDEVVKECIDQGALGVLPKPFTLTGCAQAVARVMEGVA